MTLNIFATVLNLSITIAIGFFLTPFLVSHLGSANFGLIPLTTALISYFAIFAQTISSAINRNLTIAVHKQDRVRAQRIYFSSIAGSGLVILVLAVPLTFVSLNISSLVNMPVDAQADGRILSFAMSAAFLLSIATLPFISVIFSQNKTYLYALSLALQNIMRAGLTIAFVLLVASNIASVGIAVALSTLCAFIFVVIASFRVTPWLNPLQRAFDIREFGDLFRLSADIFVMQLGTVAMMSSELIAVNLLFGDYAGGQYAAAILLASMLRNAAVSLASLAAPIIITDYARDDMETVANSTIRAMKLIGIAVALPAGFLTATASETLTVWLGAGFSTWGNLLALQSAALVLTSPIVPLYSICLAARKMWWPGVAQTVCAVLFVLFAWAGAGTLDGPLSLAGLFLGIFVIKELTYMIPYAAGCIGISKWRFALPITYSFMMYIVAYALTKTLGAVLPMRSILTLVCAGLIVTAPYFAAAWLLATSGERTELKSLMSRSVIGRWFASF